MSPIRRAVAHIDWRSNWYRDIVMFVALGLAFWGVLRANTAATSARSAVAEIQAQRVGNARLTCDDQNRANARIKYGIRLGFLGRPASPGKPAVKGLVPHPTDQQKQVVGLFADVLADAQAVHRTKSECDAFVLARVGHK